MFKVKQQWKCSKATVNSTWTALELLAEQPICSGIWADTLHWELGNNEKLKTFAVCLQNGQNKLSLAFTQFSWKDTFFLSSLYNFWLDRMM